MERVTFKNSRNLTLAGHLYRSSSASMIIMCHGFTSDKSSQGRFDRFAHAFQQLGYNVLAFDFSGCGESDDDRITLAKQADDLHSAMSFVKSIGYVHLALFGNSLGTRVCLRCYTPQISAMVLTGGTTGPIQYNWNEYFTKEQMQELKEKGYITEHRVKRLRPVIIDKQMLLDFECENQERLLKHVRCPVLMIHGNADEEERRLCEITKQGMHWLPKESRLEIIDGAGHGFWDHLPVVEKLAADWFLKHVPL
ncbi:alpha/beta hydrolase [Lihuaxuella thermophila]|uniref:Pimeloyl-ACP methyl ester carboxylesterase n=1 Tax=Lihuaxuella thermophila TaxID=1173111 RepID=A0A1H8E4Q7_9BACL|nr:alpha/beta hydrolase [Lihuaxuella thermophila]SEN14435.1 Pimeloyl-ACP methyl ester carboxylesterase [Lihuaxuella thermophila]